MVLESHIFLKEKRDGKMRGQTVAGRNKQHARISKEDSSSTNIATESILMTKICDSKENRDVAVTSIPNTFIQILV